MARSFTTLRGLSQRHCAVFHKPQEESDVTVLLVQHKVRDFDAWKPAFDEHEPVRRSHGAQRHWLYRTAEGAKVSYETEAGEKGPRAVRVRLVE
jgi:hypothetical protein